MSRPLSRRSWLALAGLGLLLAVPAVSADEPAKPEEPAAAEQPEEPAEAAKLPWVMNVADAKAQAAKEGKDLLIDFTGSDWCGWCKRLDAEVFEHASFVEAATKKFVFLYLDFPRGAEAREKVVDMELNKKLMEAYGVEGFPTIVLATADGSPYGRTGYREGGPEEYVKHLDALAEGGAKVKELLKTKGSETVEVLKAGFEVLGEAGLLGYADYAWILADAEAKDADGALGLKALVQKERDRVAAAQEELAFQKLFEGVERKEDVPFEKVRAFLDASKLLSGNALAQACALVGEWLLVEKKDPAAAKTYYERALADEWVQNIPPAKEHFEKEIAKCEEAMKPAEPAKEGDKPEDADEGGEKPSAGGDAK